MRHLIQAHMSKNEVIYSIAIKAFDQAFIERNVIPEPMSGCWLWLGPWGAQGYGRVNISLRIEQGKYPTHGIPSHRLSWMLYNLKPIPTDYYICHRCDTPTCVNPMHLWAGTPSQNCMDKSRKGRNRLKPVI